MASVLRGLDPIGTYSPTAGGVPSVPDPSSTMADTIAGLLANMPGYENLAGQYNTWANTQAKDALLQNLPGYEGNLAQQSQNISGLLQGQVSPSTWANIYQMGAERGVSTGAYGSPNANAAMMRALGLNTEVLQAQGSTQFAQQIASNPVGKQFDYATFLQQASEQQQWQYLANILKSSPDPNAAQLYNQMMAMLGQQTGRATTAPAATTPTKTGTPSTSSMLQNIMNTYKQGQGAAPVGAAPGWGEASNTEGGYASVGNVPSPGYEGFYDMTAGGTYDPTNMAYGYDFGAQPAANAYDSYNQQSWQDMTAYDYEDWMF